MARSESTEQRAISLDSEFACRGEARLQSKTREHPIFLAIAAGSARGVRNLLERGTAPDIENRFSRSAVYVAAHSAKCEVRWGGRVRS